MLELFKVEVENQKLLLTEGLLALEDAPTNDDRLEGLMRAAHSIKGAARIVNLDAAVDVAHKMEDVFEIIRRDPEPLKDRSYDGQLAAASLAPEFRAQTTLRGLLTDLMLAGVDLLGRISETPENKIAEWVTKRRSEVEAFIANLDVYAQLHQQGATLPTAEQPIAPPPQNLGDMSMMDLFKVEVENQKVVLTDHLLSLENDPTNGDALESLMRAAHSIKGAARIVNCDPAVKTAHAMEDAFEAIRRSPENIAVCSIENLSAHAGLSEKYQSQSTFVALLIDVMLDGVDVLWQIGSAPESFDGTKVPAFLEQAAILLRIFRGQKPANETTPEKTQIAVDEPKPDSQPIPKRVDSFLRVTANNLNRILALSGESQIETQRLRPFAENLTRIKRQMTDLNFALDHLRDVLATEHLSDEARARLSEVRDRVTSTRGSFSDRLAELDSIGRRHANVSKRLYDAAIACRMRPFSDGIQGFPRMVRDISRQLGKKVKLKIIGEDTQVDRDILEKLEAKITQLLRNAIDHGLESPEERVAAGKPETCTITIAARHSSGKLLVSVGDDGRGIDYDSLRGTIVKRELTTQDTAERLSESELLEFLFLPGFSQKERVTEISGRGVGLDIVYNMVKSVRGTVRIYTNPGHGTRFELQLPLTLSVLRSLLVEVNDQPYAIPLTEITSTFKLPGEDVSDSGSQPSFKFNGGEIDLIPVARLFEQPVHPLNGTNHIVVVGERDQHFGLVVDRFLGERELVVQALDPRLGKIQDVSAGALMDDGKPVLIIDVQDIIRGAERISRGETMFLRKQDFEDSNVAKRILVADDSLTVREMERQLLTEAGYDVTVAVDGVDAWNSLRAASKPFDLIVTDMDMPRMSGIELCELIRTDTTLGDLPVIMITYKDRETERQRAIQAGVSQFMTKSSFEDHSFLDAINQLLRENADR